MKRLNIIDKTHYWLLAILAFVLMIPHSMAPWGNGNFPTDVCVYTRCAEWISQGLVMYRDMFDHKGPLVYLIYFCATHFGLWGVWLMDIGILYVSLLLIRRMARLFTDNKGAILIATLISFFIQLVFCDEGGPEWITMPWCIYTCYLIAKRLKDNAYCSFGEIAVLSAAVGVCALTKPNTAACIVPIALYIAVHLFIHFDWRVLLRYIGGAIVGLGVIVGPVVAWLISQGNTEDFLNAYWGFNTGQYGAYSWYHYWIGFRDITCVCLVGYFLYTVYAIFAQKRSWQFWFVTVLFFFTVIMNAYLKNGYPHYICPCIGVFALLLSMDWEQIQAHKGLRNATYIIFLVFGIVNFCIHVRFRLMPFDKHEDAEVAEYINSQPHDSEYVMVYGHETRLIWAWYIPRFSFSYRLWLLLDGKPASPYFYMPPQMSEEMHETTLRLIEERAPYWIVCYEGYEDRFTGFGYERDKDIGNDFLILRKAN